MGNWIHADCGGRIRLNGDHWYFFTFYCERCHMIGDTSTRDKRSYMALMRGKDVPIKITTKPHRWN